MYNYYRGVLNPTSCAIPGQGTGDNGNVMGYLFQDNTSTPIPNVGHTATYTFDALNRLTHSVATGNRTHDLTFDYSDRYGDVTWRSGGSGLCTHLTYNTGTNRITQIGSWAVPADGYDAAGNLTSDGVQTYAWDARNRLQSAAGVTYTYDGDGKRVKKSSGKLYWNFPDGTPLAETDASGNTVNEYIFFAGERIARRDSSGNAYYYFQDQLGTTKTLTTSAGVVCYDADLLPFGGERAYTTSCAQNYKFTGLERDSETGLDHTLFRKYESSLGRWLSPDPLAGSILNPQSWNRYAYVLNDPTNLIDPLGLQYDQNNHPTGCTNVQCVWQRWGWARYPGFSDASYAQGECVLDGIAAPCGFVLMSVESGSAYPLPPPGQGWKPVRDQDYFPGCYYNQQDQLWDPDDPRTWSGVLYASTLPPDARVVFSQVARSTSTLTTAEFWAAWTAAAAFPGVVYNWSAASAALSNAWLAVEAAYPGATAAAVDTLRVLSPVPAVPSTWLGVAAEGYNMYEWWKNRR